MEDTILIPTPDEMPETSLRSMIPEEHTLHASVETALAQNEDLMARLKVTLRRLTNTENENIELKKSLATMSRRLNSVDDDRQVWKERENQLVEQLRAFEVRVLSQKSMAKEMMDLKERLSRFKKYQEKIRVQVKPFVQNLKNYADSLVREVQELHSELTRKESDVAELEEKNFNLESELREIHEQHALQIQRLTSENEKERSQSLADLTLAQQELQRTLNKATQYDEMRAREDELENTLVAVRREREASLSELRAREQDLLKELGHSKIKIIELQTQQGSLSEKNQIAEGERQRLESQVQNLQEQMVSLRFMWNSQSAEMEKLRASQNSLEKLNSELSRQLNNMTR